MKPIAQFKMGSSYFFDKFEDYVQKDYDEICIMDSFLDRAKSNVLNMKLKGKDVFFYRNMDKQEFINEINNTGVFMKAGKFLIPEFNEYIGFDIDDLGCIGLFFDKIDKKHGYERIIFDSYIENNGFFLTDEQRQEAYDEYKRERPDIYPQK